MTTLSKLSQYGPAFQIKVIGALLTDRDFLITISEALSDDYFENTSHQWIIKEILKYFSKYHTVPSMDALKVEIQKIENEVLKIAVKTSVAEAYRESENTDAQYTKDEFLGFCRNQQMKKAIITSTELLGMNDFDSIRQIILNAFKVGEIKSIGHEYEKDVETRYREDNRSPIPFPWDTFNNITQGGIGKGELGIIFGSPGGGKSWAVIAMAAHAAKLGFNVLYYTLELSETYVARRIDANLLGVPVDKITSHRAEVEALVENLPGKIKVKEFASGKTTLDNVEQHIEQLRQTLATYRDDPKLVAVGEIGLDFFIPEISVGVERAKQEKFYEAQLSLACEFDLPVILHVRRSQDVLLKYLRRYSVRGGIAHAFNGSMQQAHQFIEQDFALGFGGAMTFTRALQIRRLATELPLSAIVLETDAPDIAPAWMVDSRRNEPSQVIPIARCMAQLREVTESLVLEATAHTALRVLPGLAGLASLKTDRVA